MKIPTTQSLTTLAIGNTEIIMKNICFNKQRYYNDTQKCICIYAYNSQDLITECIKSKVNKRCN